MSTQVYSVPLVYYGLRPAETFHQIFDALDNLDRALDDAFGKITTRVSNEKSRLQKVNNRLLQSQHKIKQITGTNRATAVFSPAKYPAPTQLDEYRPVYRQTVDKIEVKRTNYKLNEEPHSGINMDLNSYTIEEDMLLNEKTVIEKDTSQEGLGRLPEHLPSISSLLLFNSGENPYKKYHSLDNLAVSTKASKIKEENKKGKLAEAPKTFTEQDLLPSVGTIEYGYRPTLGEVPELHLPSVLPNLPNVADISWSLNLDLPSIAPSNPHMNSSTSMDLPSIDGPTPPPPTAISSSTSTSNNSNYNAPANTNNGPPPPPPPSSGGPPPPPGPPPPGPPPPKAAPASAPSSNENDNDSDDDNNNDEGGRSSLLADIRKGLKLKSAKERKTDDKKPRKKKADEKSSAGTGDMFGDLIQALNRRRIGIAEKQKETSRTMDEEDIMAPPETADDEWK